MIRKAWRLSEYWRSARPRREVRSGQRATQGGPSVEEAASRPDSRPWRRFAATRSSECWDRAGRRTASGWPWPFLLPVLARAGQQEAAAKGLGGRYMQGIKGCLAANDKPPNLAGNAAAIFPGSGRRHQIVPGRYMSCGINGPCSNGLPGGFAGGFSIGLFFLVSGGTEWLAAAP